MPQELAIDANEIALKYKPGTEVAPVVNTATLGATTKATGFSLDSLIESIREKFGGNQVYTRCE